MAQHNDKYYILHIPNSYLFFKKAGKVLVLKEVCDYRPASLWAMPGDCERPGTWEELGRISNSDKRPQIISGKMFIVTIYTLLFLKRSKRLTIFILISQYNGRFLLLLLQGGGAARAVSLGG